HAQATSAAPETFEGAPSNYDASTFVAPEQAFEEEPSPRVEPPTPQERANHPAPLETPASSPILYDAVARATASGRDDATLEARIVAPASPYILMAGSVIAASLVTALNSDLEGPIVAQVTAPVFDSPRGRHLLIPQGARLIGAYASGAGYGQHRVRVVWTRLIFPDGSSIHLGEMPGADLSGAAGLSDQSDQHLDRLALGIGLSAILSVVANEAEDDEASSLSQSVGDAAAQEAARTGARIVDREMSVRPTLRVRAGAPVRVLVTRDLILRPYQRR
ncbi:MAG TPA: TrbI/VirB10 family protein, partial [Verrucomicrobiae bacterium]|nr:TrbI/VirB10 family protein [Verrucomicrobiae bacterium]